jgi:isocitrate dehydrogenase
MNQIIKSPSNGQAISLKKNHELNIPDFPIIPFIEGDGIGVDIMPAMQTVVDAVVKKIYSGSKKLNGWKSLLEKKRQNYMAIITTFPKKHSML